MKIYTIAYYNWFDGDIQWTGQEASSGLEAMKIVHQDPKLDHISDEEAYCQVVLKTNGFIGYL